MDTTEIRKLEDLFLRLLTIEVALTVDSDTLRREAQRECKRWPREPWSLLAESGVLLASMALHLTRFLEEADKIRQALTQSEASKTSTTTRIGHTTN